MIDLSRLKTYSLQSRHSKVSFDNFAQTILPNDTIATFIEKLPKFLAVNDIKAVTSAIIKARHSGSPVILAMGAHPIKVGLSPLIIDLINRDIITAFASNGASIIHDFEIAYLGQTSEDVASELQTGAFGMAFETAEFLNKAISAGVADGLGIGRAIGRHIETSDYKHKHMSIFRACYIKDIPATVHVSIGADIIHMHPQADGSAIGQGSMLDFRLFTSVVAGLQGGVFINLGSAVLMPEVFLKALSTVRNLGYTVKDFSTVNMDFIQHYRPRENVLRRPGGKSYALTGHHEIMFPLLYAMIVSNLEG